MFIETGHLLTESVRTKEDCVTIRVLIIKAIVGAPGKKCTKQYKFVTAFLPPLYHGLLC